MSLLASMRNFHTLDDSCHPKVITRIIKTRNIVEKYV